MKLRALVIASAVLAMGAVAGNLAGVPHGGAVLSVPPASAQEKSKDQYLKEKSSQFEEWGKKVDAFTERAKKKGTKVKDAAAEEVQKAWSDVKRGWADLKSAGQEGWDDAKSTFESNWQKLEKAWKDAQSS